MGYMVVRIDDVLQVWDMERGAVQEISKAGGIILAYRYTEFDACDALACIEKKYDYDNDNG